METSWDVPHSFVQRRRLLSYCRAELNAGTAETVAVCQRPKQTLPGPGQKKAARPCVDGRPQGLEPGKSGAGPSSASDGTGFVASASLGFHIYEKEKDQTQKSSIFLLL